MNDPAPTPVTPRYPATVDVSVIVPAYNEEKYLPALLLSIREQRTDFTVEVLVVDDSSTDRTARVAWEHGARVYRNTEGLNVVAMRDFGFRLCKGRTVLFIDADVGLSKNYIQKMAAPILAAGSDVDLTECMWQSPLERHVPIRPPEPYSRTYWLWLRYGPGVLVGKCPIRMGRWLGHWVKSGFRKNLLEIGDRARTGMVLVRREIVEAIGGRGGVFGGHEDTTFAMRALAASRRTRWVPGVALYDSQRRIFPKTWTWVFRPLVKFYKRQRYHVRKRLGLTKDAKPKAYADPKGVR